MTTNAGPCARAFDYLVEGGDPANDAEVAAHLGSCLTCFRTMTELADLPELVGRLRSLREHPAAAEPDAAFWEALPARIADAVAAARPPEPAPVPVPVPVEDRAASATVPAGPTAAPTSPAVRRRRPWWNGLALLGATAAAAAAVALLVVGRPTTTRRQTPEQETIAAGPAPAAAPTVARAEHADHGDEDELEARERIDAETAVDDIAALDEPALRHLARSLARSEL